MAYEIKSTEEKDKKSGPKSISFAYPMWTSSCALIFPFILVAHVTSELGHSTHWSCRSEQNKFKVFRALMEVQLKRAGWASYSRQWHWNRTPNKFRPSMNYRTSILSNHLGAHVLCRSCQLKKTLAA